MLKRKSLPFKKKNKEEITKLKNELQKLWESEERHWHQRDRVNWIKFGDRNTNFFHATTIQRHRQNAIVKIKNEHGEWIEDEQGISSTFKIIS
ncbi:hypothetical protein GQ457_18G001990 [Hibiscus cannabinus]